MSSKNTKEEIKEEGHTIQRTKEMAQKDKQLSTEHYTENKRLSDTNPIKHRGQIKCYGSVSTKSICDENKIVYVKNISSY
jgi:hypothetical protein